MRSFQSQLGEFSKRGLRVAAISVDPVKTNFWLGQRAGLTIPLLSDPEEKVIRPYDLLHIRGGPQGVNIARPAEFLLDSAGKVRWVNLTDDIRVRARGEQVLKVADDRLRLNVHP